MNRAATIALAPLSLVYGVVVRLRSAGYRKGILKTHRVSIPVISVGNLTVGGSGKTPLVDWIAGNLAGHGHRVCVLTRGYRRANPTQRVLVSNGEQILSDTEQSGDEAMMLAESLLNKAAVVCDADRVAGAEWVIENLKGDVLVLDDAFQHVRLARDLDIVTIDASNPWGNGWLLPAGILRERISRLSRADCIVVTRSHSNQLLENEIRQVTDAPIFTSETSIQRIAPLDSAVAPNEEIILNQPLAAFCGIGNPSAFFQQLGEKRFTMRHTEAFRDHHHYTQADIDSVTQRAAEAGAAALITTAKDAVKLRGMRFTLPCYVAHLKFEVPDSDKLLALIDRAIQTGR